MLDLLKTIDPGVVNSVVLSFGNAGFITVVQNIVDGIKAVYFKVAGKDMPGIIIVLLAQFLAAMCAIYYGLIISGVNWQTSIAIGLVVGFLSSVYNDKKKANVAVANVQNVDVSTKTEKPVDNVNPLQVPTGTNMPSVQDIGSETLDLTPQAV